MNLMRKVLGLVACLVLFPASAQETLIDYQSGDLIKLPISKGNYVMLLWGGVPIWYNAQIEWFQSEPIRNYSTLYLDVTRQTPIGDYQLVEIAANGDPRDLSQWRWIRVNPVRILRCDGFTLC